MIRIFIDGSFTKNKGATGGWGYIIIDENENILAQDYGKLRIGQQCSTRAELESLYRALLYIKNNYKDKNYNYEIITDYKTLVELVLGLGTRTANRDIWEDIEPIFQDFVGHISISHVNSHTNNTDILSKYNNLVDKLAKQGANSLLIAPIQ